MTRLDRAIKILQSNQSLNSDLNLVLGLLQEYRKSVVGEYLLNSNGKVPISLWSGDKVIGIAEFDDEEAADKYAKSVGGWKEI